jgi:hypothetical protein
MDVDDRKSCSCALRRRLAVCEQISDARPRRSIPFPELRHVEKVSAKTLWNWNLKRSNPGAEGVSATPRAITRAAS